MHLTSNQEIRIIAVPPGKAPLWVRKCWVGVSLELLPARNEDRPTVAGGQNTPLRLPKGYVVNASDALDRLRQRSPAAATWWANHLPMSMELELVFERSYCRAS